MLRLVDDPKIEEGVGRGITSAKPYVDKCEKIHLSLKPLGSRSVKVSGISPTSLVRLSASDVRRYPDCRCHGGCGKLLSSVPFGPLTLPLGYGGGSDTVELLRE